MITLKAFNKNIPHLPKRKICTQKLTLNILLPKYPPNLSISLIYNKLSSLFSCPCTIETNVYLIKLKYLEILPDENCKISITSAIINCSLKNMLLLLPSNPLAFSHSLTPAAVLMIIRETEY